MESVSNEEVLQALVVEDDPETRHLLREILQGYLFSRPVPAADVEALIEDGVEL